jgi:hypothetical protein
VLDIVMQKPCEVSRDDECVWYSDGKICLNQTSAGFSMTISNTPIASTDFRGFSHDYIKYTHRFDGLQHIFPWLYQTHPSLRLTSRFFHDYIKHTHLTVMEKPAEVSWRGVCLT